MTDQVTLTIDNIEVSVPKGTVIVDAAKKAGINVPVFCYHPKMEPVGMCRMCLVDVGRPAIDRATGQPVLDDDGNPVINFGWKLDTGCTVEVSEGMVVRGYTEEVTKARDEILEFILTSHPLDCPICDKGGECPLQNLTMKHGSGTSRFLFDEKIRFDKHVPLGDQIFLDRERCIQCARCTRFQAEVADDPVIGFFNRGRKLEIVTFSDPGFDSYWSGNTTDICPVGALTTSDFRFGARPWELNAAASICTQCPVGCNTTMNTRREAKTGGHFVVKRVMPRQNEEVNEIWMCDKGRFGYGYTETNDRLDKPLVRKGGELLPATWGEALDYIAYNMKDAGDSITTLASGRLSNEDLYNLLRLTDHRGGNAVLYSEMAGGDLVAQVGMAKGSNLSNLGEGDAILVVASDLEEEAPVWWLRAKQAAERGASLIVVNPRPTKTSRNATHELRYKYGEEVSTITGILENGAGKVFAEAKNAVVFFGSEGTNLETSKALAQACANLLIETGHAGKANSGLIGVWSRGNDQGAWDMGFRPADDLAAALRGSNLLYVAGADPVGDDARMADIFSSAAFVVVQDLTMTETAKLAHVVLPVQAFTEREGSYTTGERRVQRFYTAVPPRGQSRADFTIAAQLATRLDLELEGRLPGRAMKQISETVAGYGGVSYIGLAQVEEQWPDVSRSDLFYGGTSYENSQGMGVQLGCTAEAADVAKGEVIAAHTEKPAGLTAVPVTRLYDFGSTMTRPDVAWPVKWEGTAIGEAYIVVNATNASDMGLSHGGAVEVTLNGSTTKAYTYVESDIPEGYVLIPRSFGMVIDGPTVVEVNVLEKEAA